MYHRFFPADAAPGPLIVVLHGRGDSMGGFAWMPETLGLPGVSYLFLNAPDDYFGGFSWYGMPPEQGPGVLRSRSLLFRVLDDLRARGWDSRDILLFGFSQGCLMAIDVGARYPHPLAGVCGIIGFKPQIAKIVRERDASAVSAKMYAVTTTGFVLWVTFGVLQKSWPIVVSNAIMMCLAATILVLKLRDRNGG